MNEKTHNDVRDLPLSTKISELTEIRIADLKRFRFTTVLAVEAGIKMLHDKITKEEICDKNQD